MKFAVLETIGTGELLLLIALVIPFVVAVGLFVFLFALRRAKLKKCPFCAEWIEPETVVCRFCGRDLNSSGDQ
jgi:hypothetical protein